MNEFNNLANKGIIFKIENKSVRVKFVLGLFLGDNLGVNTYFDINLYSSNYFCRFCKCSSNKSKCQTREDINSLRTEENYENDVKDNCPKKKWN